ncbi:MAG: hypothetical protein GY940_39665 [bacterium]|nr:hypothetical protein [bacterium]
MKKVLIAVLVLLSIGNCLWCDLQEHYKKGEIVLKGIKGFGEGNDWVGLFYDPYKDMVVAPDGSVFVSNLKMHNILKFDRQGKLEKQFGRRGRGPGYRFPVTSFTLVVWLCHLFSLVNLCLIAL